MTTGVARPDKDACSCEGCGRLAAEVICLLERSFQWTWQGRWLSCPPMPKRRPRVPADTPHSQCSMWSLTAWFTRLLMALLVFAAQMQQLGLGWKTPKLKFEGRQMIIYIYTGLIYIDDDECCCCCRHGRVDAEWGAHDAPTEVVRVAVSRRRPIRLRARVHGFQEQHGRQSREWLHDALHHLLGDHSISARHQAPIPPVLCIQRPRRDLGRVCCPEAGERALSLPVLLRRSRLQRERNARTERALLDHAESADSRRLDARVCERLVVGGIRGEHHAPDTDESVSTQYRARYVGTVWSPRVSEELAADQCPRRLILAMSAAISTARSVYDCCPM